MDQNSGARVASVRTKGLRSPCCRWHICRCLLFLLVASLLGVARADTVINFDNEPADTVISTQYEAAQGVRFITGTSNFPDAVLPRTVAAYTISPPNAASLRATGGGEFVSNRALLEFTCPEHRRVSVRVGDLSASGDSTVTMTALDASGIAIPGATSSVTVSAGAGVGYLLSVSSPSLNIAYVGINGAINRNIAIDDLTFDVPTACQPSFGLQWVEPSTSLPLQLRAGGSVTTQIRLKRYNGSTGPITLAQTAPTGVFAVMSPNPVSGGDGTLVNITVSANEGAPPTDDLITVIGLPTVSAGNGPPVNIPVKVRTLAYPEVLGIEITQGIQVLSLTPRPAPGQPANYMEYPGVGLANRGKTVVRVFGRLRPAYPVAAVAGIQAVLHGTRNGAPLPGSPIKAEFTPYVLNRDVSLQNMRSDPRSAYTFTLPSDWTYGNITLTAELVAPGFFGEPVDVCSTAECNAFRTFTLKEIIFTPTRPLSLIPLELMVKGYSVDPPQQVFEEKRNLTPLADGMFIIPRHYINSIDITDIYNMNQHECGFPLSIYCEADRRFRDTLIALRVIDLGDDWNHFKDGNPSENGWMVIGVYPHGITSRVGSVTLIACEGWFIDAFIDAVIEPVAIVQDSNRPLTSVAHEMGHLLCRPHASDDCGGGAGWQPSEPWPPDQTGYIQGFGLDRRSTGLYPLKVPGSRKDILWKGKDTDYRDYMAYCGYNGSNDPDKWISVFGWQRELAALVFGDPGTGNVVSEPRRHRSAEDTGPTLLVYAFENTDGSVYLAKVGPGPGRLLQYSASPYRMIVRDGNGAVLTNTGMGIQVGEYLQDGTFEALVAEVPATGAASIEIVKGGVVRQRRVRSLHSPAVKILSPQAGSTVGSQPSVLVQWQATDADNDTLYTKVDYSADDGLTWRPLWAGPNTAQTDVYSAGMPQSATARIRVRVNDGFNESSAVSERFTAVGSAPDARILSPSNGSRILQGASLYLSGEANDELQQPLADGSIRWYEGSTLLGTGRSVSISNLPIGIHHITMVATDAKGRTGSAAVDVEVVGPFVDAVNRLRVFSTGLVLNRSTNIFHGEVILTNTTNAPLPMPVRVVLTDLSAGVTVLNADGKIGEDPVVSDIPTDDFLVPGASVRVPIRLLNPGGERPSYVANPYVAAF